MKRLFCILLLLCLLPVSGLAHQKGFGVYAMDAVNARQSPGGDILFKKQKGEELYILSWQESGGHTWYEVNTYDARRIKPVTAWVRSDMVIPPEALFTDVVQVAADCNLVVALKKDGTAVMGGELHKYPHLMFGEFPHTWHQVKQVAAGFLTVYGLKEDGSICQWGLRGPANGTTGVRDANGIPIRFCAIDAMQDTFLGLMADGSLYSFKENGQFRQVMPPGSGITDFSANNGFYDEAVFVRGGQVTSLSVFHESGFSDQDWEALAQWRDIVHIEAGFRSPQMAGIAVIEEGAPMMAGIRTDGRVIALDPALNQEVSGWADIVEIQTGDGFLLGLRQDGSVVVAGKRGHLFTQDIKAWEDIVDIACGESFCAGVTRDGRVLFAGEVAFSHN